MRLLRIPLASLRTPLASLAVVCVAGAGLWRWVDARLAVEARHQALAGRAAVVSALRDDWPASVIPAALTSHGAPGEAARRAAAARIDLAIAAATAGDSRELVRVARASLAAIRETSRPVTPRGAAWAAWLATRLVRASDALPPAERVEILVDSDRALTSLASHPREREVRSAQVAAVAPAQPTPADRLALPPAPTTVLAATPREPARSEPIPAEQSPIEPSPLPWRPLWAEPSTAASPTPPDTAEPRQPAAPSPRRITRPDPPRTLADSDRELLAEFIALSGDLSTSGAGTTAAGPTPAPASTDGPAAERRLRRAELETQLGLRGFGEVDLGAAAEALSASPADRLRLVDRLLTDRSGDAARLLLVLTDDPSAEVRASAVAALGSSPERAHVEAALERAVRDTDPRVGRLAEGLRERLR